ncbi:hypothetical protein GcC1_061033 [Golovinomyces cichoracearum]|uniref:Uncharacterized protein n=1 Tax=Golovinomyces cichoracearum TaxID=62708 RepID=A0A420IT63_9PEZI|nr:hypothetical protein GcC1_061033 [Golovinomyces cichoracearum]
MRIKGVLDAKDKEEASDEPKFQVYHNTFYKEAQITAGERQVTPVESDSRGESDSSISCIEVDAE